MQKNLYPALGEYTKAFNKFHPKQVEINEATVDDTIHFGMHLKRLKPEIAEAMDIYKALSNDTYYGPEEQSADPPQQEDQ